MKERPILFSGEMVRTILAGRKTQTRRAMNADHWPIAVEPDDNEYVQSDGTRLREWYRFSTKTAALIEYKRPGGNMGRDRPPTKRMLKWAEGWRRDSRWSMGEVAGLCPFGQPGDRLWVRETWSTMGLGMYPNPRCWYRADFGDYDDPARDNLLHERGCTRNRADCWACVAEREGKFRWRPSIHMPRWASRLTLEVTGVRVERLQDISEEDARAEGVTAAPFCKAGRPAGQEHVEAFEDLWRSINSAESWGLNPWVWVVGFKHVETEAAR